jgi:carbon-monoxide dehydrogenase small subunit
VALSREAIRDGLSGNYCRCTGYQAIVNSIESVAQSRAAKLTGDQNLNAPDVLP